MYYKIVERNKNFVYLNTFIWNTEKNAINKKKHHISFELAVRIFNDPYMVKQYDNLNSTQEEERWKCIGRDLQSGNFRTLTVSMTERGELKRIFSARKSSNMEIKDYEENTAAIL